MSRLTEEQILAGAGGEWGGILLARLDMLEAKERRRAGLPSRLSELTKAERDAYQVASAEIYGDMGYIPTPREETAFKSDVSASDTDLPPVY